MDNGHQKLLFDLELLLAEARAFEFHDFKNETHAMPKMAFVGRLNGLIENVKEGLYDN